MRHTEAQLSSELRTVITRLIKKLRKESVTGQQLSLTERSTMSLLLNNLSLLPSELAAMEKITNQSMSQILSHLLECGFIERTNSETDRRKVAISLSDKGKQTFLQVLNERDEWLAEAIQATCTEKEQELLKQALGPLTRIVDYNSIK